MTIALDPSAPSTSALLAATQWIEATWLGGVGTSLAVIAVAWAGFEMLSGRVSPRRGGTVVLGCFILFGAPMIVSELTGLARSGTGVENGRVTDIPPEPTPTVPPPYDPYAGAAVPESAG